MNGRLTRLTMKPGESATATGVLPQAAIERHGACDDGRIGSGGRDDLDERHHAAPG